MASNRTLQSNRPDHCLQTRSLRCGLSSGARLRVSPAALRQRDQDGGCLLRVVNRPAAGINMKLLSPNKGATHGCVDEDYWARSAVEQR